MVVFRDGTVLGVIDALFMVATMMTLYLVIVGLLTLLIFLIAPDIEERLSGNAFRHVLSSLSFESPDLFWKRTWLIRRLLNGVVARR